MQELPLIRNVSSLVSTAFLSAMLSIRSSLAFFGNYLPFIKIGARAVENRTFTADALVKNLVVKPLLVMLVPLQHSKSIINWAVS